MLKTFEAVIRLPNKASHKTSIQAENIIGAKELLEAVYGKGAIFGMLTEVRPSIVSNWQKYWRIK